MYVDSSNSLLEPFCLRCYINADVVQLMWSVWHFIPGHKICGWDSNIPTTPPPLLSALPDLQCENTSMCQSLLALSPSALIHLFLNFIPSLHSPCPVTSHLAGDFPSPPHHSMPSAQCCPTAKSTLNYPIWCYHAIRYTNAFNTISPCISQSPTLSLSNFPPFPHCTIWGKLLTNLSASN